MENDNRLVEIILSHFPGTQAIYLFGSYGTEDEREDSDVDIALLLSPRDAKSVGSLVATPMYDALQQLLHREIDLINLRQVPTVLQKEVVAADRCVYQGNRYATQEFEMLTLSKYQKLNEERKAIIENALAGGRFYEV